MFGNDILSDIYDEHLSVKGIIGDTIKRMFKTTLSEWRNINRGIEPSLTLKLDYAFGI